MFRVIVTASRGDHPPTAQRIKADLDALLAEHDALTLVHGACPTGGDQAAGDWVSTTAAAGKLVRVERYPAGDFGPWPACGPLRNRHMVKLGADLVLAYPGPASRGTYGCVDLAARAGLPVRITRRADDPPKRIQRERRPGYRMPAAALYVGRPTRWGNPFAYRTHSGLARVPAVDGSPWEYEGRISADGTRHDCHHPDGTVTEHHVRYMTRAEVVETYRRALLTPTPHLRLWQRGRGPITLAEVRAELAGRDLACWCSPADPCHADVLLAAANGGQP